MITINTTNTNTGVRVVDYPCSEAHGSSEKFDNNQIRFLLGNLALNKCIRTYCCYNSAAGYIDCSAVVY